MLAPLPWQTNRHESHQQPANKSASWLSACEKNLCKPTQLLLLATSFPFRVRWPGQHKDAGDGELFTLRSGASILPQPSACSARWLSGGPREHVLALSSSVGVRSRLGGLRQAGCRWGWHLLAGKTRISVPSRARGSFRYGAGFLWTAAAPQASAAPEPKGSSGAQEQHLHARHPREMLRGSPKPTTPSPPAEGTPAPLPTPLPHS